MTVDIRIIVPAHNAAPFIEQCLESIATQEYDGWYTAVVVDDASTDSTMNLAARWVSDPDWPYGQRYLITRESRGGELQSIMDASGRLPWPALRDDATVFVHLSGDDYPPAPDVLARLAAVYEDPDVWLTYGGYCFEDGTPGHCQPYPPEAHAAGDYRARPWQGSHLRSYRYGLWRQIPPEQFVDPDTGAPWFYATDRALMLPMLEMAREHARFLSPTPSPWYCYRVHPGNVSPELDAAHCLRVAAMPRLVPVETIYG